MQENGPLTFKMQINSGLSSIRWKPHVWVDAEKDSKNYFISGLLKFLPSIVEKLGFDGSIEYPQKNPPVLSSTDIKSTVLNTPLKELFTSESIDYFYDRLGVVVLLGTIAYTETTIETKDVRARLPDNLPFKAFLIDPVPLFLNEKQAAEKVRIQKLL